MIRLHVNEPGHTAAFHLGKRIPVQPAHPAPGDPAHGHPAYRPDIDGLRALAVLAVVVFHAFPERLTGGFVGVDVFFVISGYLISGIIFSGLAAGSFSYAHFYARRIRRIFPALITVLLACLVLGWFFLINDEYKQLGKHVAAGALFISNFVFWNEAGYFDAAAEAKPLLHLWSLGIEEQFYIVWPLLLGWAWGGHETAHETTNVTADTTADLTADGRARTSRSYGSPR